MDLSSFRASRHPCTIDYLARPDASTNDGRALSGAHALRLGILLLIVVVVFLIGATWPNGRRGANWGYYPGSGLGLILVIVAVLLLTERI